MRIHLQVSSEPLDAGQPTTVLCGEEISKPYFPFVFDLTFQDAANLNALLICKKCYVIRAARESGKHMLYGVVPAQEAMTAEVA